MYSGYKWIADGIDYLNDSPIVSQAELTEQFNEKEIRLVSMKETIGVFSHEIREEIKRMDHPIGESSSFYVPAVASRTMSINARCLVLT